MEAAATTALPGVALPGVALPGRGADAGPAAPNGTALEDDMNQPDSRPVGVPGGARRPDASRADVGNTAQPGVGQQAAETERSLTRVERDLEGLDQLSTEDQVPVFDRIHTALADALARTADTGGPAGGQGA